MPLPLLARNGHYSRARLLAREPLHRAQSPKARDLDPKPYFHQRANRRVSEAEALGQSSQQLGEREGEEAFWKISKLQQSVQVCVLDFASQTPLPSPLRFCQGPRAESVDPPAQKRGKGGLACMLVADPLSLFPSSLGYGWLHASVVGMPRPFLLARVASGCTPRLQHAPRFDFAAARCSCDSFGRNERIPSSQA